MTDEDALSQEIAAAYYDDEITVDSETFEEFVATKYYNDQLEYESVKQLVSAETAQRLRLLKADVKDEPLDITAPATGDVSEGDARTVDDEIRQLYERYQAAESDIERREVALKMGEVDGRRHAEIYAALEAE
jgi:tRNA(Glu) U13 pseudouridine synthase TruD